MCQASSGFKLHPVKYYCHSAKKMNIRYGISFVCYGMSITLWNNKNSVKKRNKKIGRDVHSHITTKRMIYEKQKPKKLIK